MSKKLTRKEKVDKAYQSLSEEVCRLVQSPEELETMMRKYNSGFYQYSLRNTIIANYECHIRFNRPVDILAGYKVWQERGRQVKKGQKAIYILAPMTINIKTEELDDNGEKVEVEIPKKIFKPVPVFDVTQTEGDDLEDVYDPSELVSSSEDLKISDFIAKIEVPVTFNEMLKTHGFTDGKRIEISSKQSEIKQICTLFHEMAHIKLEHIGAGADRKEFEELEAETVSFMVSSAFGIENEYSREYIASWNRNQKDLPQEFKNRASKLIKIAVELIDTFN